MRAHRASDFGQCSHDVFLLFQSVIVGRRAQHFLNFKPLPQGHGSLRRIDRGDALGGACLSGRRGWSSTAIACGWGAAGKLRAPTFLMMS